MSRRGLAIHPCGHQTPIPGADVTVSFPCGPCREQRSWTETHHIKEQTPPMTPTEFIDMVARMKLEGEPDADGDAQVWQSDECFDTLQNLIRTARANHQTFDPDHERTTAILDMATEQWHKDGEIETNDNSGPEDISEGDDNGAYVRAWVWVSFEGTALDKSDEDEDEDEEDEEGAS